MSPKIHESISAATWSIPLHPVVLVSVTGVRGEVSPLGGLVEADVSLVRENARRLWGVGPFPRDVVNRLGATSEPAILVGVQAGNDLPLARGLVVGAWEISECVYDEKRSNGHDGYRFDVRDIESARLAEFRETHMFNRLVDVDAKPILPNSGVVYINNGHKGVKSWHQL